MSDNDDHTAAEETRYRSALDGAVRLLTRRRHTRRELERKLSARGHAAETIQRACDTCERLGYVDDRTAADFYIEELKAKGYGRRHIQFSMKKKGFDAALSEHRIRECYDEEEEAAIARQVMDRKQRTLKKGRPAADARQKLYRHLYSRGFPPELIHRVLSGRDDQGCF